MVWRCRFPSPWGSVEALRRPADPGGGGKVSHLRQRVWLGRGALRPLDAQLSPRSYIQDFLTPRAGRGDLSGKAGIELRSPSKDQQAALGLNPDNSFPPFLSSPTPIPTCVQTERHPDPRLAPHPVLSWVTAGFTRSSSSGARASPPRVPPPPPPVNRAVQVAPCAAVRWRRALAT